MPDDNDRHFTGDITFTTIDVTVPLFRLPVVGRVTEDLVADNDDTSEQTNFYTGGSSGFMVF
mgnify:CR=1 FL=1